jgi:hypothetical protein
MTTAHASAAARIRAAWPGVVAPDDIAALDGLAPQEARRLLEELMAALPAGPAGATEAARLESLVAIAEAVDVTLDRGAVIALRLRYPQGPALPESVAVQLDRLTELASPARAVTGVLGEDDAAPPPLFEPEAAMLPEGVVPPPMPMPAPPPPPGPPAERFFNADFPGHDLAQPLVAGTQYEVAFDISPQRRALSGGAAPITDVFAGTDDQVRELVVQLASTDFDILGDTQRPLRLPRDGASLGKARFDVAPRQTGTAGLTATVSYQGNFITQLQLTCPVGAPGQFTATTVGRPVNAATALKPRDLGLVIRPIGTTGFLCSAMGSVTFDAVMPLTVDGLARAAADARAELTDVVLGNFDGHQPFLEGIDIPTDVQQEALRRLARAGRRLYQQLFRPAEGGADLASIGDWLAARVCDPDVQLTVQISANRVPVPWAMLYLGGVGPGDELSWDKFLGVRHIVEQLPFQRMPDDDDPAIDSRPDLTVGLNVNTAIDGATMTFVSEHRLRFAGFATTRTGLQVVNRSTRAEVVAALAAPTTADKVMYFYCHAKAVDDDPDESAIIMGVPGDTSTYATLRDLNLDAGTDVKLAGRPLVVLNACESAEMSPRFYDGFVPYFLSKGARGVIGTECKTPVLFGIHWADAFVGKLLDGAQVGQALLELRLQLLREHGNPLGLLYTCYCDASTQISPPVAAAVG